MTEVRVHPGRFSTLKVFVPEMKPWEAETQESKNSKSEIR